MSRPASGTSAVNQLWAFSADTTGNQILGYTGDNTKANVLRFNFSADGNPITAMQFSFFADSTLTAPSAGTQPPGSHNDPFTNGSSGDTSSKSYIKSDAFDQGLTSGGVQRTPSAGSVGTNPSATTGSAGAATIASNAWMSTWQDLSGWNDYISGSNAPQASTSFFWYFTLVIFIGVSITTGTFTIQLVLQYTYS